MSRVIFHVDVNSAFLSWSAAYRVRVLGEQEDLRDIPSAVAGERAERHGIIPVSYTHLRAHETDSLSRMPSSA